MAFLKIAALAPSEAIKTIIIRNPEIYTKTAHQF